jgi:dynein heavy chain
LVNIYSTILHRHLTETVTYDEGLVKNIDNFVKSVISIHQNISSNFLPSALKFHYIFSLRDLEHIFLVIYFNYSIH